MKKTIFTSILPSWSWQSKTGRWLMVVALSVFGLYGVGAQVGPNCNSVNLSVGSDDTARVTVAELVTNIDTASSVDIVIRNSFGGIIYSGSGLTDSVEIALYSCNLTGEQLEVTISNDGGTCWSYITMKSTNGKTLVSNLDTAVWCIDPIVTWDPNDLDNVNWYNDHTAPYTLLPTAFVPCSSSDIIFHRVLANGSISYDLYDYNGDLDVDAYDARDWYADKFEDCGYYAIDWIEEVGCGEGDTAKIVIREWEAYDSKTNTRSVTTDTLIVYKLPQLIADNFYAPIKDTIECELTTRTCGISTTENFSYWKQLVGLHSDSYVRSGRTIPTTDIYYPAEYIDQADSDDQDALVIKTYQGFYGRTELSADDIDDLDTILIYGKKNYIVTLEEGDQVLSNDGEYLTATSDWFYQPGSHGFWIDIAVKYSTTTRGYETCDFWNAGCKCEDGVMVTLPKSPLDTDDCATFCLNQEILDNSKCFAVIHSDVKDLGGSCPRVVKKHLEIKQLCFSDSIELTDFVCDFPTPSSLPTALEFTDCTAEAANNGCGSTVSVPSSTDTTAGAADEAATEIAAPDGLIGYNFDNSAGPDAVELKYVVEGETDTVYVLVDSGTCAVVVFDSAAEASTPYLIFDGTDMVAVEKTMTGGDWTLEKLTDPSGVTINSTGGSHIIDIEQWTMYVDEQAPLFTYATDACNSKRSTTTYTWSTGSHDCSSDVRVPSIYLKDECSGVKYAKATIYPLGSTPGESGYGWVNLEEGEDGSWSHTSGRTFSLTCGLYGVYYEFADGCHNVGEVAYFRINVVDNIAPNVVTDDQIRLSLGGKDVWMSAEQFDEGSSDNCGIRMMLARRSDWLTACGVDFCDDETNDVEEYYAEQLDWLRNDGVFCDVDNDGDVDASDNYIVQGWDAALEVAEATGCGEVDEHGNPLSDSTRNIGIGGGWAQDVPFCCEDACQEVTVELLVIDKECNYSKGWVTVMVEDKSPVRKAWDFEEITVSCASYAANYQALIEAAVEAGNSSETAPDEFAALDNGLGALLKGWESSDGNLVDADGNVLDYTFDYATTSCEYVFDTTQIADTTHDGTILWINEIDTSVRIVDATEEAHLGGAFVLCGGTCVQDVWTNLSDCGVGTITRRWRVYSGCSDAHDDSPLEFEQVINVVAGCELEKAMFTGIADTTVMYSGTTLSYDDAGNVNVEAGELVYTLDDTDCRQLGITYSDEAFPVVGQEGTFKVHRTWKVADWCSGEEFECEQKIVLIPGTISRAGDVTGSVVTSYNGGMIGKVNVAGKLSSGEIVTSVTDADGKFSFDVADGESLEIVPAKNINLLNGVNIGDIIEIQRHILGQKDITDEFKLISADINKDNIINVKDILSIRQVSLERASEFPNNESWRFFSKETLEESYMIENVSGAMAIDFIGVKVGDVDNADTDLARSASSVEFATAAKSMVAGEFASIELASSEALAGFQIALKYNPELVNITSVGGADITAANWNKVAEGLILVSYDGNAQSLVVEVEALANVDLSKAMTIGDAGEFASMAVTSGYDQAPASIAFKAAEGFELFQNSPNPVSTSTQISFNLTEASEATLTFFDVSGRVLHVVTGEYQAGKNTITVNASELGISGVAYYQLENANNSATKRLVIFGK